MSEPLPNEVTQLLLSWSNGDASALDRLIPIVYRELRRVASRHMVRERAGHTLQTTALVHEAYLRLIEQNRVRWQNRAHFYAVAAQLMRRILVDHAKKRGRAKRGGAAVRSSLEEVADVSYQGNTDLLALDEALTRLNAIDPRKVRVVELRYFAGLDIAEVATVLGVSEKTVKRDWTMAKAWLHHELVKEGNHHTR